jgi:hypothetical protein
MGTDDLRLRAMIPGRFLDVDSRAKAQVPDLGGSSTLACLVPGMSERTWDIVGGERLQKASTLLPQLACSDITVTGLAATGATWAGSRSNQCMLISTRSLQICRLRTTCSRACHEQGGQQLPHPLGKAVCTLLKHSTPFSRRVPRVCWRLSRVLRLGRATLCAHDDIEPHGPYS